MVRMHRRDHDCSPSASQQRVSELPVTMGNSRKKGEVDLAQRSCFGIIGNGSGVLAMQKVEGSSPFIRSSRSPR